MPLRVNAADTTTSQRQAAKLEMKDKNFLTTPPSSFTI